MEKLDEILNEMREIKSLLGLNKKILSLQEFCTYTNISKAYAYHLTSTGKVKCYKPFHKLIYFDIDDVIEFLKQNPHSDEKKKEQKIEKYFLKQLNK